MPLTGAVVSTATPKLLPTLRLFEPETLRNVLDGDDGAATRHELVVPPEARNNSIGARGATRPAATVRGPGAVDRNRPGTQEHFVGGGGRQSWARDVFPFAATLAAVWAIVPDCVSTPL